ncbi:MAG TPA: hypothetical protein VM146_19680 [Steroidobacteraceae bacterium]|nr:hypothetical protein [Steroidobacteraceae bacterium]
MRIAVLLPVILCAATLVAPGRALASGPRYQVAFTSFAPLESDLFLADADGSNERPFASSPALEFDASFSFDGHWVVFSSTRDGSTDVYRVHPDGTALERLVDDPAFDAQAALSPNGRTLAFVSTRSGQADIWLMDLLSRKARNLTRNQAGDFRPAWSPDGKWLAFSSDRNSKSPHIPANDFVIRHSTEIYIIKPDGTGLRALTADGMYAGSPSWSPDGKSVVFQTANLTELRKLTSIRREPGTTQLEAVEVGTHKRVVLTRGEGEKFSARWLRDGRIGYANGSVNGGIDFTSGTPGARGVFRHPDWTRNGRRLVFERESLGQWPPHRDAVSRDPDFALLRVGVFASYSPDGTHRVSNDQPGAARHNSIMMMNADGSSVRPIFRHETKNAMGPAWSPQGDRIAFSLGQFFQVLLGPAIGDIAVIDTEGGALTIVTDGTANYALPSWSPDGRRIAYRRAGPNGNAIEIIDVSTRVQRELVAGTAHFNQPAWSPVSDRIVFMSDMEGDYELYAIDADGGNLQRLTHSPLHDAHPSWSADGQWLAFTTGRGGFKDETPLRNGNPQAYGEIAVMRADGTDVRILTDDAFEDGTPAWVPSH